jgi:hypothetical protein
MRTSHFYPAIDFQQVIRRATSQLRVSPLAASVLVVTSWRG